MASSDDPTDPTDPSSYFSDRDEGQESEARKAARLLLAGLDGGAPDFAKTPTEERVEEILLLMTQGQYDGEHAITLAKKWGVSLSTVTHCACEASRLLRFLMREESAEKKQDIIGEYQQAMRRIAKRCELRNTVKSDDVARLAWGDYLTMLGYKPDPKLHIEVAEQFQLIFDVLEEFLGPDQFVKFHEEFQKRKSTPRANKGGNVPPQSPPTNGPAT